MTSTTCLGMNAAATTGSGPPRTRRGTPRGSRGRAPRRAAARGGRLRPGRLRTTALAIAPKTATPTALPIERANMSSPVTTPRRSQPTATGPRRSPGWRRSRSPGPSRSTAAASCSTGLVASTVSSSAAPAIAMTRADQHRGAEADAQVEPARRATPRSASRWSARPARTRRPAHRCPSTPCTYSGTYEVSPISSTPTTERGAHGRADHAGAGTPTAAAPARPRAARRARRPRAAAATATSSPMLAGEAQAQRTPPSSRPRSSSSEPPSTSSGRAGDVDRGARVARSRLLVEAAPQHPGRERRRAGG